MRELSLHILDIVENSTRAGAKRVEITVEEDTAADRLSMRIDDDGAGMPPEKLARPADPFVTTRRERRVGLGLSLLAAAAERCEGRLEVASGAGRGTRVTAEFRRSHIDRAPLGDVAATLATLIMGNPAVDFVYRHRVDGREFALDTRQIKSEMPDLPLQDAAVLHHLAATVREELKNIGAAA